MTAPKSALDQIEAETSAKVAKAASALSSALAARIDKEQLPRRLPVILEQPATLRRRRR